MLSRAGTWSVVLLALIGGVSLAGEGQGNAAPIDQAESDYRPLFNGRDLSGWVGDTAGYVVEDGAIVCLPRGGRLFTADEYTDFSFRFDFKLTSGANNGVGIRTPLEGDPAYVGMEIQILDDTAPRYRAIQPWQAHGSIYGVVAAQRGHLKPLGEWNSQEIIANGRRVKVVLNGTVIVDADIDEASTPRTVDDKPHPGLKRNSGHIGFLGHGARVEFKNIHIKELGKQ